MKNSRVESISLSGALERGVDAVDVQDVLGEEACTGDEVRVGGEEAQPDPDRSGS